MMHKKSSCEKLKKLKSSLKKFRRDLSREAMEKKKKLFRTSSQNLKKIKCENSLHLKKSKSPKKILQRSLTKNEIGIRKAYLDSSFKTQIYRKINLRKTQSNIHGLRGKMIQKKNEKRKKMRKKKKKVKKIFHGKSQGRNKAGSFSRINSRSSLNYNQQADGADLSFSSMKKKIFKDSRNSYFETMKGGSNSSFRSGLFEEKDVKIRKLKIKNRPKRHNRKKRIRSKIKKRNTSNSSLNQSVPFSLSTFVQSAKDSAETISQKFKNEKFEKLRRSGLCSMYTRGKLRELSPGLSRDR